MGLVVGVVSRKMVDGEELKRLYLTDSFIHYAIDMLCYIDPYAERYFELKLKGESSS